MPLSVCHLGLHEAAQAAQQRQQRPFQRQPSALGGHPCKSDSVNRQTLRLGIATFFAHVEHTPTMKHTGKKAIHTKRKNIPQNNTSAHPGPDTSEPALG
jgi:hypothetical protein